MGPNGSGKSNVIDSLLFVFGFRASKMRHDKISALIHKSAGHTDLEFCEVQVHFQDVLDDEEGNSTVVPGSELVVARRAFRNNSSKYYINGKDSSFTQVTTLLKDRGIDLDHKRFLILQGEVESIAQMKAKAETEHDDGLLEYLEDIIGTSKYKKPIEEAQAQVDLLNEECAEKTSRLGIVEKEMSGLEGKRNEILEYLQRENEITVRRSALLQLYVHVAASKIELSRKVMEEQSQRLATELDKNQANKGEVEQLTLQLKEESDVVAQLKKEVQARSKALSKQEIGKVQLEEKRKHLETKRKKLEKAIENAEHHRNVAAQWLDNYAEESETFARELSELEQQLGLEVKELNKIQDELKDKTQVFTDQIEKLQKELEPWQAKIAAKESEIEVAKSELALIEERQRAAAQEIADAKDKVQEIMKEGRAKERALDASKKELEHVSQQIELGTTECDDAQLRLSKMKKRLVAGRQKLETARENLNNAASHSKIITSLNKLTASGRLQGYHGRLGGLGRIDAKYDLAMNTVGAALDNIVVDTVDIGQQCVEYLRKNQLGRAKFILLDKLPRTDLSPIDTPEGVPRLFDLVKCKEDRFAPAFYSVLGNTLVAKDLEQARRIAYGKRRWVVVTLDGMRIEASGAMSGGGPTRATGKSRMGGSDDDVSPETVKQYEQELADAEDVYAKAEKTFATMESALRELKERKPALELDISKLEIDIKTLATTLQEAQQRAKELSKDSGSGKDDESAAAAAAARIQKLTAECDALREQSRDYEAQIEDLNEQIMKAGGVRLRMQKSKVDGIVEQMELRQNRLNTGLVQKSKSESEVKKHNRTIEQSTKEIDESASEFESVTEALANMEAVVAGLEKEATAASDALEDKQEALEELKNELEAKQKDVDSLRSLEVEIRNSLQQHEKTIKEEEHVRKTHLSQLKELVLHDLKDLCFNPVKRQMDANDDNDNDDNEDMAANKTARSPKKKAAQPRQFTPKEFELVELSGDELESLDKATLKKEIAALEEGNADARLEMHVLDDFKKRAQEYESRRLVLNEAVAARDQAKQLCDDLRKRRLDEFMAGFNEISQMLKEMYQMITMGGNAELELVDSLDPFSEGILFSVMPPKKSWRNISNLSGGEKTLSSLALVFALHHYKPTPLYVMDEIDAALDFRNVSIVGTYIKERTRNGQFIVISLRNNMFELARQLVGIYKVNNMTKSIALENRDYVHVDNTS